jgi:DNA repair protein SbcD/Mre11
MKFLHTSDWHVGKTLKGRDRLDEQRAVLREIVGIARANAVDAVLVAGDLYDTAAPSAQAQRLVVQTLLALRGAGAEVVAIAGNHDHPETLDAYRPLAGEVGITLVGRPRRPDRGGVVSFTTAGGEPVTVSCLPFISQRYAVKAAALVADTPAQHSGAYDERVRQMLGALAGGFRDDAVNVVMAHLTVTNGSFGGGERAAQSIFEYHVPASAFPAHAHYVALGHLHRRQALPAPCPVHYSGAPMMIDFGEQSYTPVVCLVEATPGTQASVSDVPVRSGRRLRTVTGTVAELAEGDFGEDYLRVVVREKARAGLREEVLAVAPNTLEVRIDPEFAAPEQRARAAARAGRTPAELFATYCAEQGIADPRVEALFAALHDEAASDAGVGA